MTDREQVAATFAEMFGGEAELAVRSPGRVNLLGEHTDYNDGFVLPIAIDRDIVMVGRKRKASTVTAYTDNLSQDCSFDLSSIERVGRPTWINYLMGVADQLAKAGVSLSGAEVAFRGDVPFGAGLSSSAALEVATALTLLGLSGSSMEAVELALLCQRAENSFVGVQCGIMDQFVCRLGEEGKALFLDCRSLDYDLVPLGQAGVLVMICNSKVRRGLAASEYNTRRRECEEAVEELRAVMPGITSLRDVTPEDVERHADALSPLHARRARHVATENRRVVDGVEALRRGDLGLFGELMNASHGSLRRDYQVSCPELDSLVDLACEVEGVFGARMTGAGFGGCTVALVAEDAEGEFVKRVDDGFVELFGYRPELYSCRPVDGARSLGGPA